MQCEQGVSSAIKNRSSGTIKKTAGKRSGLKRKAKTLLVIKNQWLEMILDGKKDCEIRGAATNKRGWIHLALSGSSGVIVGRAKLVVSHEIQHAKFHHNVADAGVSRCKPLPTV